ncbi:MAG: peptidoglycan DD-metalloendopeptidase family protein [Oligoflexia bacterium]|nr:peptidoglycan DD-metalloendopeptidase family protein [Oligoflexia bacterium]
MTASPKNEFCLWIVPPRSGKVKKFRFSLRLILASLLVLVTGMGVFTFVTGDYSRLQIIRLKNYITVRRLIAERESLQNHNVTLTSKVEDLTSERVAQQSREAEIEKKLGELATIVKSAPFKEVLEGDNTPVRAVDKSKGVGGAELDCGGLSSLRCSALMLGKNFVPGASELGRPTLSIEPGALSLNGKADLLQSLNHYIEMLKVMPFGSPVKADVTSGFGYRLSPFHRGIRMHEGVDFSMGYGSPIRTTADGVVKDVVRDPTYGLRVDIAHTSGLMTRYAHLSAAKVTEGQAIARGEVIGLVGSSGRSTGPHLHYEVLFQGNPKDPVRFIELADKLARAVKFN